MSDTMGQARRATPGRETIKVALHGAAGRMGRAILAQASQDEAFEVVAAIEHPEHPLLGHRISVEGPALTDDLDAGLAGADVIIDFSLPAAIHRVAEAAVRHEVPLVTGTTGLSIKDKVRLARCGEIISVVVAPNMSVGVNALLELVSQASRALGEGWDAELFEIHHKHKRDAPSGTALALAQRVAGARGQALEDVLQSGRSGDDAVREDGEVGVAAARGGDVVGEHTVFFFGDGERLELTHRATDRLVFVLGALRAARWIVEQPSGYYSMRDVLFG